MTVRVIPRLDIKGPNLVKGIHLEGLRVLGKPEAFARAYYFQGADELLYMDAVASLYGRNSLAEVVQATSREIFIPLCVGGGLRTVEDIRRILRAGADKVAINTAAIADPAFISRAAKEFGSSTIVVSIDAIRSRDGSYECFTDGGRQSTGLDTLTWAGHAVERGAGELLITSVDREGTGKGYDLELTAAISKLSPVPVVACGGAGMSSHVAEVVLMGAADAVCVASLLHYHLVQELEFDPKDYMGEGNTEYRRRADAGPSRLKGVSLQQLKSQLITAGVDVRLRDDTA